MDKEGMIAMSWALKGNHLKIYPVLQMNDVYRQKNSRGNVTNLHKVKLCIEIGNAKHMGTEIYKQNGISKKIEEIYKYYYKQRKK